MLVGSLLYSSIDEDMLLAARCVPSIVHHVHLTSDIVKPDQKICDKAMIHD
jgi:hypothetical protein